MRSEREREPGASAGREPGTIRRHAGPETGRPPDNGKPAGPSAAGNRGRIRGCTSIWIPSAGLAGDMFAAALLDAFSERAEALAAGLAECRLHEIVRVRSEPFTDGILRGRRLHTAPASGGGSDRSAGRAHHAGGAGPGPSRGGEGNSGGSHAHGPGPEPGRHLGGHPHAGARGSGHAGSGDPGVHHPHRRFAEIREWLRESGLARPVAERATAIFSVLAEAEAEVHGIAVEDATFHEVGAWDSIADIVCAAWLIDSLEPVTWSCAPLPLGGGQVRTAHGRLPVPAPATALLLRGFPTFHDGVDGERGDPDRSGNPPAPRPGVRSSRAERAHRAHRARLRKPPPPRG